MVHQQQIFSLEILIFTQIKLLKTKHSTYLPQRNKKYPFLPHSLQSLQQQAQTQKYNIIPQSPLTPTIPQMQPGKDDNGSYYPSINDMWQMQLNNKKTSNGKIVNPIGSQENWYNKANQYWQNAEASYNGVLGGFENLSAVDIQHSFRFVFAYYKLHPEHLRNRVIDCGAGIGRIAKQLLCQLYKTVDVIDQCQKYITKSKQILQNKNIGHFYTKGLQQFTFSQQYDCIWIQWVLSHLTDDDAIKFLHQAKQALTQHGFIILKENHWQKGFSVDKDDYSVTRSRELFLGLFQKAGLKVVAEEKQGKWPAGMLEVRMYLLR